MAKYICVQVKGIQAPARIRADRVEDAAKALKVIKGSEVVGAFQAQSVMGWWVEETGHP
jgi:hypothetical protein